LGPPGSHTIITEFSALSLPEQAPGRDTSPAAGPPELGPDHDTRADTALPDSAPRPERAGRRILSPDEVGARLAPLWRLALERHRRREVLAWVDAQPGDVIELRVLGLFSPWGKPGSNVSRLYAHDQLDQLAREALQWSGKARGVYATLNPTRADVLGGARSVMDDHVVRRKRLVIDVDPVKAVKNGMATQAERVAALERAYLIRDLLRQHGDFPDPVVIDSGNGGQLVYAIDLPVVDDGLVRRALQALADCFDDEAAEVDVRVFNPSRICRLPGTRNCKGQDTPERPHRRAEVLERPEQLVLVPREALEALADLAPPETATTRATASGRRTTGPGQQRPPAPEAAGAGGDALAWQDLVAHLSREEVARRASAYVSRMPPAISGQGGHDQTFAVACRLVRDFGLAVDEASPILQHYNERCQPPWTDQQLRHKLQGADEYDGPRGQFVWSLTNYREEAKTFTNKQGEPQTTRVKRGLPAPLVADAILRLGSGWPRRVGEVLFVPGDYDGRKLRVLKEPADLFAWVALQLPEARDNALRWASGAGMPSQELLHAVLRQKAENFRAVELLPHQPSLPGHFYLHPAVTPGNGRTLEALLDRYAPATPADRALLQAAFLTPFWGGPSGRRPLLLLTAARLATDQGVGVGKTTLAQHLGLLAGGYLMFSDGEKFEEVQKRIHSPEADGKRVVILDNIRSDTFAWAEFESLITTETISGRRMFFGEGQRPNVLTYIVTMNQPRFGRDMAKRAVTIKLDRPDYGPRWEEETRAFIEARRWELVGDILAALQAPAPVTGPFTRWAAWEAGVLACCGDVAACLEAIDRRQAEVDATREERDLVRDYFAEYLAALGLTPDEAVVRFSSQQAVELLSEATRTRYKTETGSRRLNGLEIPELRKQALNGRGGYVWTGKKAAAGVQTRKLGDLLLEREKSGRSAG
jgi:hypothetical protein